jgi:cobalt-zinc-cadmium resistance protein CzcA
MQNCRKTIGSQLENAFNQYQQNIKQYDYYINQAIPNAERL